MLKLRLLIVIIFIFPKLIYATTEAVVSQLWESFLAEEIEESELQIELLNVKSSPSDIISYLRWLELSKVVDSTLPKAVIEIHSLSAAQALTFVSERSLFDSEVILSEIAKTSVELAEEKLGRVNYNSNLSYAQIKELLLFNANKHVLYDGKYLDTPTLYLLCRRSREYPCLFIIKDQYNKFETVEDGRLWTLPALAKSRKNLPYNVTSGQTPMGVHRMDSVMPEANNQPAFGKFRRVILNWIGKLDEQELAKVTIPKSHFSLGWWQQASIARDVGRSDLRIHGTGNTSDEDAAYYPHVPTSGCISTREGVYGELEFIDQRKILDKLMESSGLTATYGNEIYIKGLLYVVEIDDQRKGVTLKDVEQILSY